MKLILAEAVTLISYHQQYQHGNKRKLRGGVTLMPLDGGS